MSKKRASLSAVIVLGILLVASNAFSGEYSISSVGVGGYDVVAYHTRNKAARGTGFHAAQHLPEFGGFCAFGASVGKKIYADPTVWKIVDGKLYLNVDSKIQKKFERDLRGNLAKAYANWPELEAMTPEGI
jgi:hypothetical protein